MQSCLEEKSLISLDRRKVKPLLSAQANPNRDSLMVQSTLTKPQQASPSLSEPVWYLDRPKNYHLWEACGCNCCCRTGGVSSTAKHMWQSPSCAAQNGNSQLFFINNRLLPCLLFCTPRLSFAEQILTIKDGHVCMPYPRTRGSMNIKWSFQTSSTDWHLDWNYALVHLDFSSPVWRKFLVYM